jgi:F0F1-type ATP synthase assembly protein I
MSLMPFFLLAIAALLIAGYAQLHISQFTAGASSAVLTRAILIAVGVAFGWVAAVNFASDPTRAMLALIIGFGAVHFPAAFILFIKAARNAGKS